MFYWGDVIALLIGGILGAAGLIVRGRPTAAELIGKITPWQGWIGVILLLWGIWTIIGSFGTMVLLPLIGLLILITGILEVVLGFLLGWSLIVQWTGGGGEKGEAMYKKISPFQGIFGIIAICAAIFWFLFALFLWRMFIVI
jgi:hypothetical protein